MKPIAALLAVLLAMPAVAQAEAVLDAIKTRGTLRVGTTGDYKPFTFRNADGTYAGADIEMAQRLAGTIGVRLEIVPTTWAKLNADYAAGRFDIAMGGVTNLPARAAMGPFSRTVFVDGKRPIARCADRDRFTSIAAINLPTVRVVVNPGAANEQFARANFPAATLTVHADNATVFDEIAAGRADVMVTDGIEVDHQAHLKPSLCPTAVPAPFTHLEKAYWLQKDSDFEHLVATWLDTEIGSGQWQKTLTAAQQAP
ncbi:Prephenate dehydratase / Arogenate dehydratase [Rhodovastum atsumiense]|uniref:Transporter substrate-binding domain-containing protein n=1 Tax=Rhodovastum atsumiense TaxID=504468 RepID=A0A5M6ITS8_9PROT|nr:transporter substrate-binding domain-containing protein [Rhodovastum atsumiense]KAA5611714.1 transporter substrate-binding domain-containing protein [Rhodovastum atsumiense]CAH2604292.1 Prephenate dehydratase / Arogenate dehydratase [Rhodovastum atsumiense]